MSRTGGSLMEVARRCSVSQSTVSRVLNNSKHGRFSVSQQVRERILNVARELNYRPSMAARNLTASQTHLIAVLGFRNWLSDAVGPIERAVATLSRRLDAAGYESAIQYASERHNPFAAPPLRVDGIVAVGVDCLEDVREIEASGVPYISINGVAGKHATVVAPDDLGGAILAMTHLYNLGHRRIAYLDHLGAKARHPSVFERRAGFAEAQRMLGFSVPQLHMPRLGPNEDWEPFYAPFLRAAVVEGGATAVLTYSHQGALGLRRAAHDIGLSIPGDFSLLCYNDEPMLKLAVPSITAIDLPAAQIGEVAADVLLSQMRASVNGEEIEPQRIRIPETLVARESTAAAPR